MYILIHAVMCTKGRPSTHGMYQEAMHTHTVQVHFHRLIVISRSAFDHPSLDIPLPSLLQMLNTYTTSRHVYSRPTKRHSPSLFSNFSVFYSSTHALHPEIQKMYPRYACLISLTNSYQHTPASAPHISCFTKSPPHQ